MQQKYDVLQYNFAVLFVCILEYKCMVSYYICLQPLNVITSAKMVMSLRWFVCLSAVLLKN